MFLFYLVAMFVVVEWRFGDSELVAVLVVGVYEIGEDAGQNSE